MGISKLIQLGSGKYGATVLVAFMALQGYLLIRPSTPPLDPARAATADALVESIAGHIGQEAGADWSGKYVHVARMPGDPNDAIRGRLEDAIGARTNCTVVTDSLFTELRDATAAKSARLGVVDQATADSWQTRPVGSLTEALEKAQATGLDYVVYGVIEDFRALEGRTFAKADIKVAAADQAALDMEKTFTQGDAADVAYASANIGRKNPLWRLVVWLIAVLLLPIVTSGFWSTLLERESNAANAACLLFLTLVEALLTWTLMGFWLGTIWLKVLLALATAAGAAWNLFILNVLERNRVKNKYAM